MVFLSHKFSKEWGGQQSNSKEWQALSPETCEAGWPSAAWGFALRGYFAELQSSEKGCAVCVCCHKQHDGSVPRRPESGPGTLLRSAWLWESHGEGHLLLHHKVFLDKCQGPWNVTAEENMPGHFETFKLANSNNVCAPF